ncbi:MAG: hypothetical protein AB7I36_02625 [Rhodospirillaceae bacterium]
MASKKAAKKKIAKKSAKKAPRRSPAGAVQAKRKTNSRSKIASAAKRDRAQQPAGRNAKQTPQRKAASKRPASAKARPAKPAPKSEKRPVAEAPTKARPRKQIGSERAAGAVRPQAEKRRDGSAKGRQQRREDSRDRMTELPPANKREEQEQHPQVTQHTESRPQFSGGDDDSRQQSAETPEDEGYGRSAGADNNRLGKTGEYGADDDELHYGRNLGGRNRIPGGGSRRNR